MKKVYITPNTQVLTISASPILAGSLNETLKTTEVSDDTEGFVQYSRGISLWDDEE